MDNKRKVSNGGPGLKIWPFCDFLPRLLQIHLHEQCLRYLYEAAEKQTTATSQDEVRCACHENGIRVMPSGRLPSERKRPLGSLIVIVNTIIVIYIITQ